MDMSVDVLTTNLCIVLIQDFLSKLIEFKILQLNVLLG